jgi:hypothetical protein
MQREGRCGARWAGSENPEIESKPAVIPGISAVVIDVRFVNANIAELQLT